MIITQTPLRISFTGGGTDIADYYKTGGGAVVSMAIDKYIYISVNRKFDNIIRINYSSTEIVKDINEIQHELVREALRLSGITGGIEITSVADIPSRTGLGSSSSFTVGVLNALFTYCGTKLTPEELAELACKIEIDILGHPIGKQDQYAASFGGLNYFCFLPDDSVCCNKINLSREDSCKMQSKLMLFYTGVRRSADRILYEQKRNICAKTSVLTDMKNQAEKMYNTLTTEGFNESFGEELRLGWEKKKTLADCISNPEIIKNYNAAINAGAVGGKLLGAGGGGFLLFYCDEEYQDDVRKALGLRQIGFKPDYQGSRVIYFA